MASDEDVFEDTFEVMSDGERTKKEEENPVTVITAEIHDSERKGRAKELTEKLIDEEETDHGRERLSHHIKSDSRIAPSIMSIKTSSSRGSSSVASARLCEQQRLAELSVRAATFKKRKEIQEAKLRLQLEEEELNLQSEIDICEAKNKILEEFETAERFPLDALDDLTKETTEAKKTPRDTIVEDPAAIVRSSIEKQRVICDDGDTSVKNNKKTTNIDLEKTTDESFSKTSTPDHVPRNKNSNLIASSIPDMNNTSINAPSAVDNQIVKNNLPTLAAALAQINLNRLPAPEPDVFYGDSLAYTVWLRSFETLIENRGIPDHEKLHYLNKYVGGEAKEAIEGFFLLSIPDAYQEAKKLLNKRYGNKMAVADGFRDKLESWQKIGNRDGLGLRKFSDFLHQCETASHTIPGLAILGDERENRKMTSKLPDWLVTRWGRFVSKYKRDNDSFPTFKDFVGFVEDEADICCDPLTSVITQRNESVKLSNQKSAQSHSFSVKVSSTEPNINNNNITQRVYCYICKDESHDVNSCGKFLEKSMNDRKACVMSLGLCFSCLNQGHRSSDCTTRKVCEVCTKRHPTSLHWYTSPNSGRN